MATKRAAAAEEALGATAKKAREPPLVDAPINLLPLDMLTVIFAYTPMRPVLLSVSLVCRRWRTAALRSVTSIRVRGGGERRPPLSLFPSLTELKFSCNFREAIRLPLTIRRLALREATKPSDDGEISFPAPLPPFTHLSFRHWSFDPRGVIQPLILASLDTLTSLRVEVDRELCDFLHERRFPRLAELHIAYWHPASTLQLAHMVSFLSAHCSTLTSLTIDDVRRSRSVSAGETEAPLASLFTSLAAIDFPSLTFLRVLSSAIPSQCVADILRRSPRLVNLCLPYASGLYTVPTSLLTPLVKLRFLSSRDPLQPGFIEALPRLRHISVRTEENVRIARDFPAALYPRMSCLSLGRVTESTWSTLVGCTSLTHLNITPSALPSAALALSFPQLTKLKLHIDDLYQALPLARLFLRVAPCLHRVTIDLRVSLRILCVCVCECVACVCVSLRILCVCFCVCCVCVCAVSVLCAAYVYELCIPPYLDRLSPQAEFNEATVPEMLVLLQEMQRAGVQKVRLYPSATTSEEFDMLTPLMTYCADHGGWLKVVLMVEGDNVYPIGSALEFREMRAKYGWYYS